MRIVHCVTGLNEDLGGPARSVPGLALALGRGGDKVDLCTSDFGPAYGKMVSLDCSLVTVHTVLTRHINFLRLHLPAGYRAKLRQVAREADVIHSHGIWTTACHHAARVARELKVLHVISPRGSMTDYGMTHRGWKKRLAMRLFASRDWREAVCWHATGQAEADFIRKYGMTQPIMIVPIGLDPEPYMNIDAAEARQAVEKLFPEVQRKRLFLFLSRVHPQKGLEYLAEAWGRLSREFPDWHLLVTGPGEAAHVADIKAHFDRTGASARTSFSGPVYGKVKSQLLAACDVFVLPTLSENFGIAIAEAMASGKPVITTVGTPWQELAEAACGWYTQIGTEPTYEAMRQAAGLTDERRCAMGAKARQIIQDKYAWASVARATHEAYQWLLGRGPRPACVQVD